jgi:uncharacterized protein with von Willebrand factor type A (vWA) domain
VSGPLRGVDRASFAVALTTRLRAAGVPVGFAEVRDFVHALSAAPPTTAIALYWTARLTLVHRPEDLEAFDAVLRDSFGEAPGIIDDAARQPGDTLAPVPAATGDGTEPGGGLPWITLPRVAAAGEGEGAPIPHRLPSALEALADRPFDQLDEAELAALGEWLRAAIRRWPTRRTRRQHEHPAGHRIALRPTIARARRTGWEPITLVHAKPIRAPRRVVLLCDVSQSMQAQIPAYRILMRALSSVAHAETFAFATKLTRTLSTVDAYGGTRIASAVRDLLHRHDNLLRGAIVLLASDGWDSDPPEDLAAAMARLHRRAHRVIWLNPRAASPGFEPRVAAVAAALPHCDAMLPADTFRQLRDALETFSGTRTAQHRPRSAT